MADAKPSITCSFLLSRVGALSSAMCAAVLLCSRQMDLPKDFCDCYVVAPHFVREAFFHVRTTDLRQMAHSQGVTLGEKVVSELQK